MIPRLASSAVHHSLVALAQFAASALFALLANCVLCSQLAPLATLIPLAQLIQLPPLDARTQLAPLAALANRAPLAPLIVTPRQHRPLRGSRLSLGFRRRGLVCVTYLGLDMHEVDVLLPLALDLL